MNLESKVQNWQADLNTRLKWSRSWRPDFGGHFSSPRCFLLLALDELSGERGTARSLGNAENESPSTTYGKK